MSFFFVGIGKKFGGGWDVFFVLMMRIDLIGVSIADTHGNIAHPFVVLSTDDCWL